MTGTLKIQSIFSNPVWFAGFDEKRKPRFHNPKAIFSDRLTPAEMTRQESDAVVKKLKLAKSASVAFWVWEEKPKG
jgi:hypothetical protein